MTELPGDICTCGAVRSDHPIPGCPAWKGRTCYDCPDLDNDVERPAQPWSPRARCCRDEHLDRRAAGDTREWDGIEDARERSAADAALDATLSRQTRRHKTRKARK